MTPLPVQSSVVTPRTDISGSARIDYQIAANHTLTASWLHLLSNRANNGMGQYSLVSRAYSSENNRDDVHITESSVLSNNAVTDAPVLDANNQPIPGETVAIGSLEQYRRTLLFAGLGYSAPQIRNLGGGASQFSIAAGNPLLKFGQTDLGLYLLDDWKVKPNITVSLGLRYETQTNIQDLRDFAPRVGIAWAPPTKNGVAPKRLDWCAIHPTAGPGMWNVNMRISKTFSFGARKDHHYGLNFNLDVNNIFNHLNQGGFVGNLSSPLFGQSTAINLFRDTSSDRRTQFGTLFSF